MNITKQIVIYLHEISFMLQFLHFEFKTPINRAQMVFQIGKKLNIVLMKTKKFIYFDIFRLNTHFNLFAAGD